MGILSSSPARVLGRYALYEEIASGGMATVHFGRLSGVVGFAKTVAIKRLHPHLARDPEFVSMFLDEARLAARIRHPNVVSTLDVVTIERELFLVMEYVQGESLIKLERVAAAQGKRIPPAVVATVVVGMLHGLHAAHEAANERGEPLGIVHRDVSPQNVLVGVDGVPRVFDFGVAKAAGRCQTTREGTLKGKLAYMSPEQLMGGNVTRATDIFAASAVLWGALVGRRLFKGDSEGEIVKKVLDAHVEPPSKLVPGLPSLLDAVVLRGLSREAENRFATAREMARALEKCMPLAPASEVGELVEQMAGTALAERAESIARIESSSALHSFPNALSDAADGSPESGSLAVPEPAGWPSSRSEALGPVRPGAATARAAVQDDPSKASNVIVTQSEVLSGNPDTTFLGTRSNVLRRMVLATMAVAGALLFIAIGASLRVRPEPRSAAAFATAPPTAPAFATAARTASTLQPATAPGEPMVPSAANVESPPASEIPVASADSLAASRIPTESGASPQAHPKAASGPPKAVTARPAISCDPPFTVDADGFRHYKRECVR